MFTNKKKDNIQVNVTVEDNSFDNKTVRDTEEIPYDTNALIEAYKAIKEILLTIKEDENDPNSQPFFKTIKVNNGQLNRIKNNKWNLEYALAFPAVFVHFINIRYLVQQSRIGEGRAVARIQFVLNRLNNSDADFEMEGFAVFQRINAALQSQKSKYPALTERFQLQYFDQPESFDDGLQPYWIDYEIWFKEYSGYRYKDYVETHIVIPPFTNHSDQLPESNPNQHPNHTEPKFEEIAGFNEPS